MELFPTTFKSMRKILKSYQTETTTWTCCFLPSHTHLPICTHIPHLTKMRSYHSSCFCHRQLSVRGHFGGPSFTLILALFDRPLILCSYIKTFLCFGFFVLPKRIIILQTLLYLAFLTHSLEALPPQRNGTHTFRVKVTSYFMDYTSHSLI